MFDLELARWLSGERKELGRRNSGMCMKEQGGIKNGNNLRVWYDQRRKTGFKFEWPCVPWWRFGMDSISNGKSRRNLSSEETWYICFRSIKWTVWFGGATVSNLDSQFCFLSLLPHRPPPTPLSLSSSASPSFCSNPHPISLLLLVTKKNVYFIKV